MDAPAGVPDPLDDRVQSVNRPLDGSAPDSTVVAVGALIALSMGYAAGVNGFERATDAQDDHDDLVVERRNADLEVANVTYFDGNTTLRVVGSNGIDRLVVDSTMLLERLFPEVDNAVEEFVSALKQVDATTLLISEMTDPSAYATEHYLAHGVLFFHNYLDGGEMTRGLQLLKMRGTAIDCAVRPLSFDERGVVDPDETVSF